MFLLLQKLIFCKGCIGFRNSMFLEHVNIIVKYF